MKVQQCFHHSMPLREFRVAIRWPQKNDKRFNLALSFYMTAQACPGDNLWRIFMRIFVRILIKIFQVYMTDFFFICSIKSPQCTDKYSKKVFSIAIFLSRVLMYQKHQISLPVGYKTARPKTGDWERLWHQFRTPSLAKNRFLRRFLTFS